MIERIPNLPDYVLGLSAKGKVTGTDYESIVIPAAEDMFSRYDKVRVLYHLGEDFTGFEMAAMWDDAKLGMKHLRGWDRVAVVSDVEWIRAAIRFFGVVIPGRVRVFHNCDLAEATRWMAE